MYSKALAELIKSLQSIGLILPSPTEPFPLSFSFGEGGRRPDEAGNGGVMRLTHLSVIHLNVVKLLP
jgi:hypothetical protein